MASSSSNLDGSSDEELKQVTELENGKITLSLKKSVIRSNDLQIEVDASVNEIDIECKKLIIDCDFPTSFRGKNLYIVADIIEVSKKSVINLSGNDNLKSFPEQNCNTQGLGCDGGKGDSGENGGICNIISEKIINPTMLTIVSNGGNGSDGQNGGDGRNGTDGIDVQLEDFTYKRNKITVSNFSKLIGSQDSQNFIFEEDGFQKLVIFDAGNIELLMLIKGSKGECGKRGGLGRFGGKGGKSGSVNIKNMKFIGNDGQNGRDGKNGFNGENGKDGSDAYMIIKKDIKSPIYDGLNSNLKFELSASDNFMKNSVYYEPLKKYFYISKILDRTTGTEDSHQVKTTTLDDFKVSFCEALVSVLKNSNELFYELTNRLKIRKFLDRKMFIDDFFKLILKNSFKIHDYDTLKHHTESLKDYQVEFEEEVLEKLHEYIKPNEPTMESKNIIEIKAKILTSEFFYNLQMHFTQLNIICDILHIKKNLPDNFRGKNIAILAKTIHIHNKVEWNLSGWDDDLIFDQPAKIGTNGADGQNGQSGGNCTINCDKISNSSLWTIKSNGGNGSNGQNGGDGVDAVDGKDPKVNDFKIKGEEINSEMLNDFEGKNHWIENGMEKSIYVESDHTYLMLVKGTRGTKATKGNPGGIRGAGGQAGDIIIKTESTDEQHEVKIFAKKGQDGTDGIPGKTGVYKFKDGCAAAMYVSNDIRNYIGVNKNCFYNVLYSKVKYENSVLVRTNNYYPKMTHFVQNPNSILDDIMIVINLISVLRNAFDQFDNVIDVLRLEHFSKNKISLQDLVSDIKRSNLVINHFKELQRTTKYYQNEADSLHDYIRTMIAKFIEKINVSISSKICTIKKKILMSSELFNLKFDDNLNEFHIICDTLHINSNLPDSFRGKNLAVVANFVFIHNEYTWNLSGSLAKSFKTDAGQDKDGKGYNGQDGAAGNSGGNFRLECKFIENFSLLKVLSNGSNGADGQDGGNGRNGTNGQDAKFSDFFIDGTELKFPLSSQTLNELKKKDNFKVAYDTNDAYNVFYRGNYTTDNGLKGLFYYRRDKHIVIVHGEHGEKGSIGGVGGYGGNGGHPGEIIFMCENLDEKFIRTVGDHGNDGKKGKNGWNGFHGREGGDIYKYKHRIMTSPFMDGINSLAKFNIFETKADSSLYENTGFFGYFYDFSNAEINDSKIYSNENKSIIEVKRIEIATILDGERNRNESVLSRSKYSYAIANKNELIDTGATRSENSKYLDSSMSEISNKIAELERKSMTVQKITKQVTSAKNPEIDIESIKKNNANYLDLNFKKIIEDSQLRNVMQETKELDENLRQKFEMKEKRIIPSDKKQNTKYHQRRKRVVKNLPKMTYEDLCNMDVENSAKSCIEFLKTSKLNEEQFVHLINKLALYNEGKNDEKGTNVNDKKESSSISTSDIINLCKEKYSSLIYENIYNILCNTNFELKPSDPISLNSSSLSDQILFLRDKKMFDPQLQHLSKHFYLESKSSYKEVYEYFNNNCKNHKSSIGESVFNHLINRSLNLNGISYILSEFSKKARRFDDFETYKSNDIKRLIFSQILNDFYTHKEIKKFIKEELESQGIQSPIYRKILAHKYGLKLVFCRHSLDESLKIFECHNYRKGLRLEYSINEVDLNNFDYDNESRMRHFGKAISKATSYVTSFIGSQKNDTENKEQQNFEEIFILVDNGEFSILNFDKNRYEAFRHKQAVDKNFNQVKMLLENPSDNISSLEENQPGSLLTEILPKLEFGDYKFSTIFKNQEDEPDVLYTNVISNFSKTFYTLEDDKVVLYEIDNEDLEEIQSSEQFHEKNEGNDRAMIKHLFGLISKIGGISILRSIDIRLKNNENKHNLQEFSTVLKAIFLILYNKEDFVVPLTFMILGMEQTFWIPELIMVKTFRMFGKEQNNMKKEWINILLDERFKNVVWILLKKLLHYDESNDYGGLTIDEFNEVIKNLVYFDDNICNIIEDASLKLWSTITPDAYWNEQFEKLQKNHKNINVDELKTIFEDMSSKYGIKTRKLLELFIKNGNDISKVDLKIFASNFTNGKWPFGDDVLNVLKNNSVDHWNKALNNYFSSEQEKRTLDNILDMMKNGDETSENIKNEIDGIKAQIKDIKKHIEEFNNCAEFLLLEKVKSSNDSELLAIIATILKLKANIELRDTQLVSILTMHNSQSGVLMQVSTGEGKTLIGVVFAILKVLLGEKVDIITSSSVLAIRDATNEVNKQIFNFFDISVDHNCYEKADKRSEAYKCKIVYGTLCNFQRDYLLTEFHEQKIMLSHHFKNIVVDEVDSMLLDKGNNILYLSQDLPDLDEIENIFIFIWQWLNQQLIDKADLSKAFDTKLIRSFILDNIYGILNESIIDEMEKNVDSEKIIGKLKQLQIIDEQHIVVEDNFFENESKIESVLKDESKNLVEKIKAYCRNKLEMDVRFRIPNHLKSFVLQHLDQWIESGKKALYLNNAREYIIDTPKSAQIESDPNVTIIDLDTGTDMKDSQWDEGLHQFLQIKYGCKLSPLSLKSVFISNVSFFKKYDKLYGMTGTLGCLQERQKMTKIHNIDFVTIPRYVSRKFKEYFPIVRSTREEWLKSIQQEVQSRINEDRSILIICKTIQDTQIIKNEIKCMVAPTQLIAYQRDYDKLDIAKLGPGYIIISTNLAGRGTDIKLSQELEKNEGLHVILTDLPDNSRIEEQALGRAARSGESGTGRLIIWSATNEPIAKLKEERNQNELKRLDEISTYYENFIKIEENFFEKFRNAYESLKGKLPDEKKEVYLLNFVIQWSFWLDRNSQLLYNWKDSSKNFKLKENFETFLLSCEKKELHPIMEIELTKQTIGTNDKRIERQKDVLENKQTILKENSNDDLIAFQYLKLYKTLKCNQMNKNFRSRDLLADEILQIKKCLKMISSAVNSRLIKIELVKHLKQLNTENLQPVDGFEKQQKEIIEIYEELANSLKVFMGEDINPKMLRSDKIDNIVMQTELYEELLDKKYIRPPQISSHYSVDDLKVICRLYLIKYSDLNNHFMKIKRKCSKIESMEKFEIKLIETFSLPNRLEFWNTLKEKDVLKDEVKYAIVSMDALKNVDPSAREMLLKHDNKYNKFTNNSDGKTIFFTPIDENQKNEDVNQKFAIKDESLISLLNKKRYDFLLKHDVIEINMKARFNIDKLNSIQKRDLFDKFTMISLNDLEVICENHKSIAEKLVALQILICNQNKPETYFLNHKNLDKLSDSFILGEDNVYHQHVNNLLKAKFAYVIALESLIEDVQSGNKSPVIQLEINPYADLINDLFEYSIIEQAKVDETNIYECENLFKNSNLIEIFGVIDITVTEEFRNELIKSELIDSNSKILEYKENTVNFSDKYKHIQSTSIFLLQNRRKLLLEVDCIKQNLMNLVNPIKRNDILSKEVVLIPLDEILPNNNYVHFMKLKGLGSIIRVQKRLHFSIILLTVSVLLYITTSIPGYGLLIIVALSWYLFKYSSKKLTNFLYVHKKFLLLMYLLIKLKFGSFSFNALDVYKTKILARFLLSYATSLSFSNQKYKRVISKPLTAVAIYADAQVTSNESTLTNREAFEHCKKTLIKSKDSSNLYLLINDYLSKLTSTIVDYVCRNVQEEITHHDLGNTIEKIQIYAEKSELKTYVEREFPEIENVFGEIKKIRKQVFNILEDITNLKDNPGEFITVSVNLVANTAPIKESVKKIFNSINTILKDFLDNNKRSEMVVQHEVEDYIEDYDLFGEYFVEQIKKIATIQCKNAFNSYVVKPAMCHSDKIIKEKGQKIMENDLGQPMNIKPDNKIKRDALKLYEGMRVSKTLEEFEIPEDLTKQAMHIRSMARNCEQFVKRLLENLPYDEICIESIRKLLEKKLDKKIVIEISKNGNIFEFGLPGCEDELLIKIEYSKANLISTICEKNPELEDILCSKDLQSSLANIINNNNNINKAIKSYNDSFFKNFRYYIDFSSTEIPIYYEQEPNKDNMNQASSNELVEGSEEVHEDDSYQHVNIDEID